MRNGKTLSYVDGECQDSRVTGQSSLTDRSKGIMLKWPSDKFCVCHSMVQHGSLQPTNYVKSYSRNTEEIAFFHLFFSTALS